MIPCKEYLCPKSKLCIPKTWVCDGTVDCGHEDGSDESGDCSKYPKNEISLKTFF